ncbi:MAG: PepSY-associated TM helix domain-containing protein [Pseudomonadota bacterium]
MKASTLKTFTSVHTWTGLGAGMALFIAFYAGAITIFFHELESWEVYGAHSQVAQSVDDAQQLVDRVITEDPAAAAEFRLYPTQEGHPENVVYWYERHEDGSFEEHRYRMSDSGALDTRKSNEHLPNFIYRLHYTAGLPSSFGLYVLGIICLLYGVALVTGLLIFLPKFLKDLLIVRSGKNKKQFWRDAHNVVGVISLPWHFMFAWSSAILAIGIFFIAPFQLLVFEDDLLELFGSELGIIEAAEPSGEAGALISVPEILAAAKREIPTITTTQIRYYNAGDANGSIAVYGTIDEGTLSPNAVVTMAATSGEVIAVSNPESATVGATIYQGLISLHFVSYGGFTAKWANFFLGLAGAFLFYSGNILWIETRRKRRSSEQPATGRFLARLNSGVCIGCMAGISAAFLASRVAAELVNRPEIIEITYFGVFLASIAWCFMRPVAAGTRDLLYATAALTVAIPVFDALYTGMPLWTSLARGHWALFTVDALAVAGAVVFWWLGRAVERRAYNGDVNSVWAQPLPQSAVAAP